MKILIQWSMGNPFDWEEIDSSQWTQLPKRPEPSGRKTLDQEKGWLTSINVQGVIFGGDHYAVEDIPGGCRIYCWDNGGDARIWEFLTVEPDIQLGNAINTRQVATRMQTSKLVLPPSSITRHGVWMKDALYDASLKERTSRGWREWTEGLPSAEISNGRIPSQRAKGRYDKPLGTRTYYVWDDYRAQAPHVEGYQMRLVDEDNPTTEVGADLKTGEEETVYTPQTVLGEPLIYGWPTGDYRIQTDVPTVGVDIVYGFRNVGGTIDGHFGMSRVDTTIAYGDDCVETKAQTESAFSGSGLKMATTGSVSWSKDPEGVGQSRGGQWYLFHGQCTALNATTGHSKYSINIEIGTSDSFADGPWIKSRHASPSVAWGSNF